MQVAHPPVSALRGRQNGQVERGGKATLHATQRTLAARPNARNLFYLEIFSNILHNSLMQLEGIDVFVEVVDARSFARAAERLRMPPATVSAKIARLEENLGISLIQRTTRRMHVTAAGEAYYRHCIRAVAAMRDAEQELTARSAEPSGCLRLTAPVDLSQFILPPIVERFLAQWPKTSVEIIVTNRRVDLLAEGIDLAIRAGRLQDSRLTARKLLVAQFGLWASPDYLARHGTPHRPADLANHSFIGLVHRLPIGVKLRSGSKTLALPQAPRILCDDIASIRIYVERGNGIGLLPNAFGLESGLVRIFPDYCSETGTASLVYPAQKFVPPAVKAFIATAVEVNAGAQRRP